jgi:hypothetical protein
MYKNTYKNATNTFTNEKNRKNKKGKNKIFKLLSRAI